MVSLSTSTVTGMLEAFSSREPLPAGAAAAALTAALGGSLLAKMAALGRHDAAAVAELAAVARRLVALADEDSRAYAVVLEVLRLPRTTAAEVEERRARLGEAMRRATEVPLEMLRVCCGTVRMAPEVATMAPAATRADVNVALELLRAAVLGMAGSVDSNLGALRDRAFADEVRTERAGLEAACRQALDAAAHRLHQA